MDVIFHYIKLCDGPPKPRIGSDSCIFIYANEIIDLTKLKDLYIEYTVDDSF